MYKKIGIAIFAVKIFFWSITVYAASTAESLDETETKMRPAGEMIDKGTYLTHRQENFLTLCKGQLNLLEKLWGEKHTDDEQYASEKTSILRNFSIIVNQSKHKNRDTSIDIGKCKDIFDITNPNDRHQEKIRLMEENAYKWNANPVARMVDVMLLQAQFWIKGKSLYEVSTVVLGGHSTTMQEREDLLKAFLHTGVLTDEFARRGFTCSLRSPDCGLSINLVGSSDENKNFSANFWLVASNEESFKKYLKCLTINAFCYNNKKPETVQHVNKVGNALRIPGFAGVKAWSNRDLVEEGDPQPQPQDFESYNSVKVYDWVGIEGDSERLNPITISLSLNAILSHLGAPST